MTIDWKNLTGNEKRGTKVIGPFGEIFVLLGYVNKPLTRDDLIKKLDVGLRVKNCLRYSNILTIGQLLDTPKDQIFKIKNLGRKAINELIGSLIKEGFDTNLTELISDRFV
jgi:hypothetical protein